MASKQRVKQRVKGPRVHRMVVRTDRPALRGVLLVVGAVVITLLVVTAWRFGQESVFALFDSSMEGAPDVRSLLEERARLREKLAVYEVSGEVSRQAEEQVRIDNRALQDRVAELEQAVAWYRRVAVPDRSGKGLRVEQLGVSAAGAPQVWLFQLLLVRTGEMDAEVEGHLEGTLTVRGANGRQRLPIEQVLPADRRTFRLRYVQDLKTEFRLPPGQVPESLQLSVVITAPRAETIDRVWPSPRGTNTQEVRINAGQG